MKKRMIATMVMVIALGFVGVWATVNDVTNKVAYVCNGSTTTFAFTFPIVDTSDMVVILRTVATGAEMVLDETTHYSLSATNNDYSSGGTVTTVSVYSSAYTLTLIRNVPESQGADLEDSGVLRLETLEDALNRLTLLVQDLEEELGRSLKFPRTETVSSELDTSKVRASQYLGFDSAGTPTTLSSGLDVGTTTLSTYMEGVVQVASEGALKTITNLEVGTDIRGYTDVNFVDIVARSPWIDVRAFGATGDGATDDTTAMNLATTAANAAGGGVVYVPKGSYKLTASLVLHNNTTLYMDAEAILLRYFSGDAAVAGWTAKNGTIRNATKDVANRDSNIVIIGGQIYSNNASYVGNHVMMWGVDNFLMDRVKVLQAYGNDQGVIFRGDGAIFSNLNMNLISDTNTEATPNDGIHIYSGTNIKITNCYIKTEDDCISLANGDDEGNSAISDVVISNCNLVSNRNNIKIAHNWDLTDLIERVTITNCVGYQTGAGGNHIAQNVTILPENGSVNSKITDIAISNCVFYQAAFAGHASYNSHSVFVKGSDNVFLSNVWTITPNRTGYWIQDCNNIQIRGGGVLTPRNSGHPCIQLYTVNDVLIDGVYVTTPTGTQNILINDVCDNIKVTNCTVKGIANGSDGIATNAESTVDGLIIIGNMFDMAGATGYGYQAAGTESNIIFTNNDCRGVTKGVKVFGDVNSGLIMRGNIGYVTEKVGTATLLNANTTIAVAHGLAETPTVINITWREDPTNVIADWWIDTIGATNFTLNGADPGANNLDFGWEAKVR